MKSRMTGRQALPAQKSPPSRGAWIEMNMVNNVDEGNLVAPLAGGVD